MDIATLDKQGKRVRSEEEKYLKTKPLDKYGWDRWIGGEPHGADIENCAMYRDPGYIDQAKEYLDSRKTDRPFIMVINLVNPHDYVLYPRLKIENGEVPDLEFEPLEMQLERPTFPKIPTCPDFDARKLKFAIPSTIHADLSDRPSVLKQYKEIHENHLFLPNSLFQQTFSNPLEEIQFYYHCLKMADEHVYDFLQYFKKRTEFKNTWVNLTADHGEALLDMGLRQKWHGAIEGIIHIPLIFTHPKYTKHTVNDTLTSSIDVLPTLLEIADERSVELHGQSIIPMVLHPHIHDDTRVVYFCTYDEITRGQSQVTLFAVVRKMNYDFFRYDHLEGNIHVEALIYHGREGLMKIVRYFNRDNPQLTDEWELFNLTVDKEEVVNLASVHHNEMMRGVRLLTRHSIMADLPPQSKL